MPTLLSLFCICPCLWPSVCRYHRNYRRTDFREICCWGPLRQYVEKKNKFS